MLGAKGKSGASQEEASKHVNMVQPSWAFFFSCRYHKGTQNALYVVAIHPVLILCMVNVCCFTYCGIILIYIF